MKISTNTINTLKNFSSINPSIIVSEGNVIKTVSPSKTIMARAEIQDKFPRRFAIYNLNQFISVMSLFNDPELIFEDNSVKIVDGNRKTEYFYASENTINVKPPEKDIVLPSVDVSFKLNNVVLKEVEKAAGVLSLPEIAVVGDGNTISLQAVDSKSGGNVYSVELEPSNKVFRAIFKVENIKIQPLDYNVSVCSRGISHFSSDNIQYWIAVEQNSTF